jgi:D-alanyl-D-alanine carboxypeptidase
VTALDEVLEAQGAALQARIGAFRRQHRLPGVVAGLADSDGLRWWHAAGHADLETGRRADERTLHRIASISKTVTATAVLQLRDEGRLRLDDPAVRHVPELARIENRLGSIDDLTVRRLLMHTSGLQGEAPWQDNDRFWLYRPDQLPAVLGLARVATPPEVDHKYSNLAYEILGLLVERIAGRPFTDQVRAAILDPLGMADTVWDADADPDQRARKAVGYDARRHDDRPARARDVPSGLFLADGGLWSTVEDLCRWVAQQLRTDPGLERGPGQVLRGASLAEMHRPSFVGDAAWTEAQGLCWYGTRKAEVILVGHSGALWGFRSNVSFSITGKVGAIVLLNGIGNAAALARGLLELLLPALEEARDRADVAVPEPVPAGDAELLGVYVDQEFGDRLLVEWREGRLVIAGDDPDEPEHRLARTGDPLVFTIEGGRPGGEPLVFLRGDDGRIDRCNANGYPMVRWGPLRDRALEMGTLEG